MYIYFNLRNEKLHLKSKLHVHTQLSSNSIIFAHAHPLKKLVWQRFKNTRPNNTKHPVSSIQDILSTSKLLIILQSIKRQYLPRNALVLERFSVPWKNRRGRPRCWRQSRTFIIRLPCLNDVTLMRCSVKHKFRSTACDWSLRCCLRVCLSSAYVYTCVCISLMKVSSNEGAVRRNKRARARSLT